MEAGVPILPLTVNGGRVLLPKKSLHLLPGKMEIIAHTPIPVDGYTYETKETLMEEVRRVIESDLRETVT